MFKVPLPELKEKIIQSGRITPRELEQRIKDKINELSGLISEEGAAHILANEYGVNLAKSEKLKIKEIYAGMRNITTTGKVIRKFDVREFNKGDKSGKVCSLILGDDSATMRVVFWNDQVDLLNTIQEGDILQIKEGYARENRGESELHLGEKAEIVANPPGVEIDVVRKTATFPRKSIVDLGEEGSAEILGTIVQVFDPRFFEVCPDCNKRVRETQGGFECSSHGFVQPALSYVLNLVIDDGTGNIRTIFWKNQTNILLAKDEKTMVAYKETPTKFEEIKDSLFGEQFKLVGKVQKNEMFNRLEFNVQVVEKANPADELARLEKK